MQGKFARVFEIGQMLCVLLGAVVSGRIWMLQRMGALPCMSSICDALDKDPLSRPLGIPLSEFGIGYFLLSAVLSLIFLATCRRIVGMFLLGLLASGSLTSIFLIGHTWLRYQSLCPWCTVVAAANLGAFGCCVMIGVDERARWKWRSVLTAVGVCSGAAIAGTALLEYTQTSDVVDVRELAAMTPRDLFRPNTIISPTNASGPLTTVFVDFSCSMCRQTLPQLVVGPNRVVSIRFVRASTSYAAIAAKLVLDSPPTAIRPIISEILDGPEGDVDQLTRIRKEHHLAFGSGAKLLDADESFAKRIGVRMTPLAIQFDHGRPLIIRL